jgi:hypothetical protein
MRGDAGEGCQWCSLLICRSSKHRQERKNNHHQKANFTTSKNIQPPRKKALEAFIYIYLYSLIYLFIYIYFTTVFSNFTTVFSNFTTVFSNFTTVFSNFTTVFSNFTTVFLPHSLGFKRLLGWFSYYFTTKKYNFSPKKNHTKKG